MPHTIIMFSDILLPFRAFRDMRTFIKANHWVWRYIYSAIAINIIVFCITLLSTVVLVRGIANYFITLFTIQNTFILAVVSFIVFVFSFYLASFLFTSLSTIVSAPLYGDLTDRIIKNHFHIIDTSKEISWYESIRLALLFEGKKIISQLLLFPLIILNLIPFVGQIIYTLCLLLQIIVFAGLDIFEPIFVYHSLSFRSKAQLIFKHKATYWPFLLVTSLLVSIPIVNILILPFAQITAIFLYSSKPFIEE